MTRSHEKPLKSLFDAAPTAKGLTEQKNFWINVDKTSFILGFAEQVIGAEAGDKTVSVDFSADFVTPQLQGKKAFTTSKSSK